VASLVIIVPKLSSATPMLSGGAMKTATTSDIENAGYYGYGGYGGRGYYAPYRNYYGYGYRDY